MNLTTRDLSPAIGSEVMADAASLLGGSLAAEIKAKLTKRGVLLFRDVHFDDEELNAFAASIAPIDNQDERGNYKVTMDTALNPHAMILYGTRAWHMDRLDTALPPLGTLLSPRVLSLEGGETEFANTYAAYEALSDQDKALIEDLEVEHTTANQMRHVELPAGLEGIVGQLGMGTARVHPLVWRHRSGRRSLVLGWTATRVIGMDLAESDALIARLIAHAEQPQFTYRHQWRMGDVVMWDNTGTMHRVQPFEEGSKRYLHRVTLAGEEPLVAA